jgi:predicted nucleic acid-binding protein
VGAVVLDSSVVLGILDPEDVHHPAAVAELRRRESAGDWFVIPSLVLAEVLVGVARAEPGALERRQRDLSSAFDTARPLDEAVAVAAARLRARHRSLRMPDAIVIATGIVDEVDAILTADRRWAGVDPRVVVLSP